MQDSPKTPSFQITPGAWIKVRPVTSIPKGAPIATMRRP